MNTRVLLAVALSVGVVVGGVGAVVGVGETAVERTNDADESSKAAAQDYEVSLDNVTIETWIVRNSTVLNATVREVVIRNATTPNATRENVTLENVTVRQFAIEQGELNDVNAQTLIVRNKSVLDVPGGDFFDPDVQDQTIEERQTDNETVSGVVIDTLFIDAGAMGENASIGPEADDIGEFSPVVGDGEPAITVENGTIGEAVVESGEANDWAVESVSIGDEENEADEEDEAEEGDGEDEEEGDGENESDGDGDDSDSLTGPLVGTES